MVLDWILEILGSMLLQKPKEIAASGISKLFCKLQNPQDAECLYKGCPSLVNKHHPRRPGSTICLGLYAYVCQHILILHKSMLYRQASKVARRRKQDSCVIMSLWDTGGIIPLIQLLYYCYLSPLVQFHVRLHYVTQKYIVGGFENSSWISSRIIHYFIYSSLH